jgi:hypothetical protein
MVGRACPLKSGDCQKPDAFEVRLSAQAVFTLATPDLQTAYSTHTKHAGKTSGL